MSTIFINAQSVTVEDPCSLSKALSSYVDLTINPIVIVNKKYINSSENLKSIIVNNGDIIEIIKLLAGG
jgi:sulfur carrier protein ThiS